MRFRDLLTVASLITLFRLGLAATAPWWAPWPSAVWIYLVALASDVLDGEVARRTGTATRAGAAFDAWVDKALHVNFAWSLAVADRIPDVWLLAWCARELIQAPLVFALAHRFRTAEAPPPRTSAWGRATAILLAASVLTVLVGRDATVPTLLTGLAGTVAGIRYAARYLPRSAPAAVPVAISLEASLGRT